MGYICSESGSIAGLEVLVSNQSSNGLLGGTWVLKVEALDRESNSALELVANLGTAHIVAHTESSIEAWVSVVWARVPAHWSNTDVGVLWARLPAHETLGVLSLWASSS